MDDAIEVYIGAIKRFHEWYRIGSISGNDFVKVMGNLLRSLELEVRFKDAKEA